jgi:hypothetical protein
MVLDVGPEQKLRIQKIALYFPLFEDGSFLLMEVRRKNIFLMFFFVFCMIETFLCLSKDDLLMFKNKRT